MRAHRRVPFILAAAVAAVLAAAPAALAATWTVRPGGSISGNGPISIGDATTGTTLKCNGWNLSGTLKSGSGLSGTGIGQFTSIRFNGCADPAGVVFPVTASPPWKINALSDVSGTLTGSISGIHLSANGPGCAFVIDGTSATAHNGMEKFKSVSGGTWKLLPATSNMHFWDVAGCFGLVANGDRAELIGSITISPKQTITSP